MGIYVFDAAFLCDENSCATPTTPSPVTDFGKDARPLVLLQRGARRVCARPVFAELPVNSRNNGIPYWRDVGTIDAFWQSEHRADARRARSGISTPEDWPIWTSPGAACRPRNSCSTTPDRRGTAIDSIVAGRLHRQRLDRAPFLVVLERPCPRLLHGPGFGAPARRRCGPPLHAEEGGDRQVFAGCRTDLPSGSMPDEDRRRFHVTKSGITLVTPR